MFQGDKSMFPATGDGVGLAGTTTCIFLGGSDVIFGKSTIDLVKSQFGKFNVAWSVVKYGTPKLADGGSITLFSGAFSRSISKGASCLGPVNTAIECFTKCVAKELAPRLRVNCVSPLV